MYLSRIDSGRQMRLLQVNSDGADQNQNWTLDKRAWILICLLFQIIHVNRISGKISTAHSAAKYYLLLLVYLRDVKISELLSASTNEPTRRPLAWPCRPNFGRACFTHLSRTNATIIVSHQRRPAATAFGHDPTIWI